MTTNLNIFVLVSVGFHQNEISICLYKVTQQLLGHLNGMPFVVQTEADAMPYRLKEKMYLSVGEGLM